RSRQPPTTRTTHWTGRRWSSAPTDSAATSGGASPFVCFAHRLAVMSRRGLVSLTTRRRVRRSAGDLATAASRRVEEQHVWYASLTAQEQSWVGMVAQAGILNFVEWLDGEVSPDTRAAFGAAPQQLTRRISLAQTLELVRPVVEGVEA